MSSDFNLDRNRSINGRAEENENFDLSEDALRQALNRLGAGKGTASRNSGTESGGQGGAGNSANGSAHGFDHAQRRRRFVQDGEVVVERHGIQRQPRSGVHVTPAVEDGSEIERQRSLFRQEQRRREDLERQLGETQVTLRSLETRAGHAEMIVGELRQALGQREREIGEFRQMVAELELQSAALKEQRSADRARISTLMSEQARRPAPRKETVSRKPEYAAVISEENEPEPVKWWLKKKS